MHLNYETEEGMISTFRDFGRRDSNNEKIVFRRVEKKRITSLTDWVKDKLRLDKPTDFKAGTYKAEFIAQRNVAATKIISVIH